MGVGTVWARIDRQRTQHLHNFASSSATGWRKRCSQDTPYHEVVVSFLRCDVATMDCSYCLYRAGHLSDRFAIDTEIGNLQNAEPLGQVFFSFVLISLCSRPKLRLIALR